MKVSLAVACLISTSQAVQLKQRRAEPWTWDSSKTPWDKDSLPDCPSDTGRTIMDDGKTHVSKYPNVGATCKMQTDSNDATFVQFLPEKNQISIEEDPRAAEFQGKMATLEHCPDFNERFTLKDGRTKGVPYPEIGFNCNPDYTLAKKEEPKKQALTQKKDGPNWGADVNALPHCPDFDERFTLNDGRTRAVPYPQIGYNCKSDYQMVQRNIAQDKKEDPNWGPNVNALEHCPDFDERFTLKDGRTRAVPFPQVGFNCRADYQMIQQRDPNWGPSVDSLPHCPDFDERMTLNDGKTRGVPYPEIGYNCKSDYQLVQKAKKDIGSDIAGLQHCPDFDERFTLVDGRTRAIPYPQTGYNCNPEYAHAQKQSMAQSKDIGGDISGLQHCPDFDERFTLTDGKTKAIPYPQPHYNCNPEYALHQQKQGELKIKI